jgi:hypothetical protein
VIDNKSSIPDSPESKKASRDAEKERLAKLAGFRDHETRADREERELQRLIERQQKKLEDTPDLEQLASDAKQQHETRAKHEALNVEKLIERKRREKERRTNGQADPPPPGPAPEQPPAGTVIVKCVDDIPAEPIKWLWRYRIPKGKITVVAGLPGQGKSQLTCSIASVITTGGSWPVDGLKSEPGNVLFLTAEDAVADTLRPRLEAAGANLKRCHFIQGVIAGYQGNGTRRERMFALDKDVEELGRRLAELREVSLIVVDPISAYLGRVDAHKNAEVRALLAPLHEMIALHHTAFIGITHFNKTIGGAALLRVLESVAFVATPRAIWFVTEAPEDKTRHLFLPAKLTLSNIQGLAYRIEGRIIESAKGDIETSCVMWESKPVATTADEAMAPKRKAKSLNEAVEWLRELLTAGPLASTAVHDQAESAGIAFRTLERAKAELKVESTKDGDSWLWSLPKTDE